MKEAYPDDIMLCFVQVLEGDRKHRPREVAQTVEEPENVRMLKKKQQKRLTVHIERPDVFEDSFETMEFPYRRDRSKSPGQLSDKSLGTGRSRLSQEDGFLGCLPEVKRSFSDRFSIITDGGRKSSSRKLLAIKKTWSTGNFAPGAAAGGGCAGPRSAPATPLQLEPHPRATKHDKQVVKPLSGSAPSVRTVARADTDSTEAKPPSKARQKKFQRHFPQVGPEERVLNYYSCALVGDLLLQGHLYITKNYFAFYSNVFGYVTKLLIPITSVLRITKEKVARIIPNAVGVCTSDERHVFGSLLSRDSTYKLMTHVWKAAMTPENVPKPQTSEVELDASEYSPEDDSSSGGADQLDSAPAPVKRESEAIITTAAGTAVIQPALITGRMPQPPQSYWQPMLLLIVGLLACSALVLIYQLCFGAASASEQEDITKLSGEELYSELVRVRARLHGRAATELHAFLTNNLLLLTKVRQSLEALSGVLLADMAQAGAGAHLDIDVPNETVFS